MSLSPARTSASLLSWGATDRGRVRPSNEDCFGVDLDRCLCVVADGMGGHQAGEVASRIVVDDVIDSVRSACGHAEPRTWESEARHWRQFAAGVGPPVTGACGHASPKTWKSEGEHQRQLAAGVGPRRQWKEVLSASVHAANARILELAAADPALAGMGSTVVAAIVRDGLLTVAHAGDSRAYLFDGQRLRLLTRDDSWVATMLEADPDSNPAVFEGHPMRNVLINVVGLRLEMDVHVQDVPLAGGELVLLTTDGVHGVLHPERIVQIITDHPPAEVPGVLIAAAIACGSRDNCTAVVARRAIADGGGAVAPRRSSVLYSAGSVGAGTPYLASTLRPFDDDLRVAPSNVEGRPLGSSGMKPS